MNIQMEKNRDFHELLNIFDEINNSSNYILLVNL